MFKSVLFSAVVAFVGWFVVSWLDVSPLATGLIVMIVVILFLAIEFRDPKTKWYDFLDMGSDLWD